MFEITLTPHNREEFERIAFVLKARLKESKDSPFTTVVHVERTKSGSRLIATDRARLHIADVKLTIKEGDYRPIATKDSISFGEPVNGIKFPAWEKIIPDKSKKQCVLNLEQTGLGKNKEQTAAFTKVFKNFLDKTGKVVNLGFLEDLPKREWAVYRQPNNEVILFKPERIAKGVVAVMMPLNTAA